MVNVSDIRVVGRKSMEKYIFFVVSYFFAIDIKVDIIFAFNVSWFEVALKLMNNSTVNFWHSTFHLTTARIKCESISLFQLSLSDGNILMGFSLFRDEAMEGHQKVPIADVLNRVLRDFRAPQIRWVES